MTAHAESLFDVLRHHAHRNGRAVASIDDIGWDKSCMPTELTYADLCVFAEALAGILASELPGASRAISNEIVIATAMHRGNNWYCVFWACARLQIRLVALSVDLPDLEVEKKRNVEILEAHQPRLIISDEPEDKWAVIFSSAKSIVRQFCKLWERFSLTGAPCVPEVSQSADAILCYCYTGGTTKASRCAQITHRMALHEVEKYPSVVRLSTEDRVFQQHSVYWAASAYGEIDVALAFGCALVFAEAWDADSVASKIRKHAVTCVGLVPSILAALDCRQVSSLKCVFTWGEELQVRVAREWAKHVQLIDLLISTECWLSLYANWSSCPRDQLPLFTSVPGVLAKIKPPQDAHSDDIVEQSSNASRNGELLVAGPMVCTGYTDCALNTSSFEIDSNGTRWYCTKDCVEQQVDGFKFAGRADDMVKVGGAWVDTRDIERQIRSIDGVTDVCICGRDAFVSLSGLESEVIAKIRLILPVHFALYVVPSLPRNAGTGKVDRRRLHSLITAIVNPITAKKEMSLCVNECASISRWYSPLIAVILGAMFYSLEGLIESSTRTNMNPYKFGTVVLHFIGWLSIQFCCRILALSYIVLFQWHKPCPDLSFHLPFGVYGVAITLCSCLPVAWCIALAIPGVFFATKRGRTFSWPLVWALGFPIWMRDQNDWMKTKSSSEIALWYLKNTVVTFKNLCITVFFTLIQCLNPYEWFGKRKCGWCGKKARSDAGRVEKSVGPLWYCNVCWVHFYNHKECSKCKKWSVKGAPSLIDAKQATHKFKPGEMGITCDDKGFVEKVGPDGPVRVNGISKGDQILNIGTEKYSKAVLAKAEKSGAAYEVTFLKVTKWLCFECNRASLAAALPNPGSTVNGTTNATEFTSRIQKFTITLGTPPLSMPQSEKRNGKRCAGDNGACGPTPATRRRTGSPQQETPTSSPQQETPTSSPQKRLRLNGQDYDKNHGTNCWKVASEQDAKVAEDSPGQDGPQRKSSVVAQNAPTKSREWKIIEQATSMTFNSISDSLLSLDSLRHAKIMGALRREVGKRITRSVLKHTTTIGGLLDELARLSEDESHVTPGTNKTSGENGKSKEEYTAWGMMWNSRCQWVLRVRRKLPVKIFEKAVEQLIERHPALRAEHRDPYNLFYATQQALSALMVWRTYGPAQSSQIGRCMFGTIHRALRWGLKRAWPRIAASSPKKFSLGSILKVLPNQPSFEAADIALWEEGRMFHPPFRAIVVPYKQGNEEGALIQLAVTHMLSDGYSVVPLLDDIASFVARIENTNVTGLGIPPPLPNMFGVLERRLQQTIDGNDDVDGLYPRITPQNLGGKVTRQTYMILATLPPATVGAIRKVANSLAVPDDIVMLAAIGITLAWFENRFQETIAMIVPQRDGPGESDMVGLFSDLRHLDVCTEGLSLAGVALRLHHVVKERLWRVPQLKTQFDMTMVNFEWTDFEEKNGFAQHIVFNEIPEKSFHPLRVAVDQPERDVWRTRIVFQEGRFTEEQRRNFLVLFERSLRKLKDSPLELVWPTSSCA